MPEADLIELFVAPQFLREGGSEKHLRDIRSMLALSPEPIDRRALADWIRRLGLEPQWSEVGEPL